MIAGFDFHQRFNYDKTIELQGRWLFTPAEKDPWNLIRIMPAKGCGTCHPFRSPAMFMQLSFTEVKRNTR